MSQPAAVFPPGDHIREEMDARGLTVAELAVASRIPEIAIAELLAATTPVTETIAWGLSRAFGTGPDVWLNLEATWRQWRERGAQ